MWKKAIWLLLSVLVLVGCGTAASPAPETPVSTLTPRPPSSTPPPTWTPTPSPTPTPVPPLRLSIRWPATVSAVQPLTLAVDLEAPPGVTTSATVRVTVLDPAGRVHADYDLVHAEGARYESRLLLQLPLEPHPGYWWVIAHVDVDHPVVGQRALAFKPAPVTYRDLSIILPSEAAWRVPMAFETVTAGGDAWSGWLVYDYRGDEVGLWWAPGPTEALRLSNAVTMLEATHDPEAPAIIEDVEEMEWQGRTAFRFAEAWPGTGGGPATAWVIQGDSRWLYVLRVLPADGERLDPSLVAEVAATFGFVE